jgi:hypothetical protein
MQRESVYPKANVLPLPFASNNIYSLGCLDWGVNVDVDRRERVGVHHNFVLICYFLGVNRIRGQNICPTSFASHVWHRRGNIRLNLSYLPLHPQWPPSRAHLLPPGSTCGGITAGAGRSHLLLRSRSSPVSRRCYAPMLDECGETWAETEWGQLRSSPYGALICDLRAEEEKTAPTVGDPLLHPHPATLPTADLSRLDGGLPMAGTSILHLRRCPVAIVVDPGWEGKSYLKL